ncbi:hypothetical protein D6C95_09769, partial [Aureobasidium pullulans]
MADRYTFSDTLSSAPQTSILNVPTEYQRSTDFRSTAPEVDREEEEATSYYKDVDWSRIPTLERVSNGKGASSSPVWKYGWRMQEGKHIGANIAETIAEIITRFDLQGNIGFFIADNATNNDTYIEALAAEFTFDATERRLRCAGHIFNLVARALLWGTNEEAFLKALAGVKLAAEELECWRRRGPLNEEDLHTTSLETDEYSR